MKYFYKYYLQERCGDFWRDVYCSSDRYYVEQIFLIFRKKYPSNEYRLLKEFL